ncbi:serine--tRNA ligase [Candidatus Saccharibacteria bacterium]|nr:MAG: serine--tRNA ligase [Candidatus Saccharibacteria bacterium]
MLDIRFIRENAQKVQKNANDKGYKVSIDELLVHDDDRRTLQQQVDELRTRRNEIAAKMKGGQPDQALINEGKQIKIELADREELLRQTEDTFFALLKAVPNMSLDEVPVGMSENDNVEIRVWGDKPQFDFAPKNHAEIAEAKGWLDKERGAKIAGSRFVYTMGDLVLLEMALWQFGMNVLTDAARLQQIIDEHGLRVVATPFTPILPPAVAKQAVFEATGRLNRQEQTYKIEDEDLWLNASAEHTISPIYLDEILDEAALPIRYVGYTTAFRREAGTYGKDTEGIFRLHQFNKLEMECFTTAETSYDEHLFLVAIQEYLMQQLGLPYHVLEKCTADIGRPNAKGVDVEVWLPSQDAYRETHTADYIGDYQTRAMKTRVRRADGSIELAHTNDATAFSQRPLVGILENYQTADGDVVIPEALRPYMGGRQKI